MNHYKVICKQTLSGVGDYLESIIMEDPEGFLIYKDYYEDHYAELRIPCDFTECTTARDKFYQKFQEEHPGETFTPTDMPDDMSDELLNLYYSYRHEFWLLTFEQARESFDLPYTYFLLPDEETHYTMYMIDGERTEDTEHPGYLYMGDSYYEDPDEHELLWKTWFTGQEYDELYEWDNKWGNTYSKYTPLLIDGKCIGLIVTEMDVKYLNQGIVRSTVILMLHLSVILVIITAGLLFFISKYHIRRINHLSEQINEFSSTRAYDTVDAIKAYPYGADEISMLADNTADMIKELQIHEGKVAQAAQFKSDFLANMSHEIRTPMNAIVGLSDMLIQEELPGKSRSFAEQIRSSANAMLVIINDILDFSRIESGNMKIIPSDYNLVQMINDLVNVTSLGLGGKPVTMKLNLSPEIPQYLYGDSARIRQILSNVISNAVKFTKEGSITINIDHEKTGDKQIDLKISVSDTGIGIRKTDYERIFESFMQIDSKRNRSSEGTGLGLAITQRLVLLMNGTINVESEYGVGSVFRIVIPQQISDKKFSDNKVPAADAESVNAKPAASKARILVVDDNSVNLYVARSLLGLFEIKATCVKSGKDALTAVSKKTFDLILMDHMMPEMDGVETMKKIRQEYPDYNKIPIIAFTANAVEEARDLLLNEGMDDFISKPVKSSELEELLKKWLPKDAWD
ncbi:MAG: response regulator [Lachnospiraceae bacterium]|nr:response regulator [Lachnospiraceae bacterium]